MKYDLDILIREPTPFDKDYLYSTWSISQFFNKPFKSLDYNWYMEAASALISRLLIRSHMLVAANPNNPEQIFGYVVFEPKRRVLHFCYTKSSFRRANVATRLMEAAFGNFEEKIYYTVCTTSIFHYHDKWNLEYNSRFIKEEK